MSDIKKIRSELNVRPNVNIRECNSFDAAVLWCYRHDFGPIGVASDDVTDPGFKDSLRFALPHLEDYLRLILVHPQNYNIHDYANLLYSRIFEEFEKVDRHSTGHLVWDSWLAYHARFRSVDFDISLRDAEVSIYPFRSFEIDIEKIAVDPPRIGDIRCAYLVDLFQEYFPKFSAAASVKYQSYEDKCFKLHASAIIQALWHFLFSNPAVPSGKKYEWRDALDEWKYCAAIELRPSVVGGSD